MALDAQIRIVQAGSELFAFDCIRWPGHVFQHPLVYQAIAMNHDSYDANLIGWRFIEREQYEWIVKHYSCMVGALGKDQNDRYQFFCHHHQVWERAGKDFSVLSKEKEDLESLPVELDSNEEREI